MSEYLIAHIGHSIKSNEHITWWKPNSRGYTICIEKAGAYSEDDARGICHSTLCIAVPKAIAEQIARSTPYFRKSDGSLAKLYDGDKHCVVPNAQAAWRHLFAGRLSDCAHPIKPTPIGAKARAIYIDAVVA